MDPTAVTEHARPVPAGSAPDVIGEVWHALRAVATEREAGRVSAARRAESVRDDLERLAGAVVEVAHQLRSTGDSRADALLAGVRRAGLIVLDPAGEQFTDDWADLVEVAHSEPDGAAEHSVVREVWRPGLMAGSGRVVQRAVVALVVPAAPVASNSGQEADQ